MTHRILLVGATGAFGARLASLLAGWDVTLVLAARRSGPLTALADALRSSGAVASIETAAFDRTEPAALAALRPWAVVDAAGPFQTSDLRLPSAAIAAGAHYVDIADGRAFVAAFPGALDRPAMAAGVLAVTGASSTPALSQAVLAELTAGWRSVDVAFAAISPGARAPRGLSVVRAILSYVGRPVRVFTGGRWVSRAGWSLPRRIHIPDVGTRWVALCETPDLDLIPTRLSPAREGLFLAGLELAPLNLGLWLLAWPVRLGLVRDLQPLARLLRSAGGLLAPLATDRGGMLVEASGVGRHGERRLGRWSLGAPGGTGPTVPVAAAAAILRGLRDGRLTARGARTCVDLVVLPEIVMELDGLPIATTRLDVALDEPVLFRRVLGSRFEALPTSVAAVHGTASPALWRGTGRARGARWLAPLRTVMGLPQPGGYPELAVTVTPGPTGERWRRAFGATAFSSNLAAGAAGEFEERFGLLRFRFGAEARPHGFLWRFVGWGLGPLPLPRWLAPEIRARAFDIGGGYRFRVAVAYRWAGVIFAYAGRLTAQALQ